MTPLSASIEWSSAAVMDNDDAIGRNNDFVIGGGEALGGENNNQQMMGLRVMTLTGINNARGEGWRM